jgi:hypothetical protein
MGLLERLWEVVLGEIDDIVTELRAYARERAWSLDTLAGLSSAQLHVGYSLNQTYAMHLPPARLVPFWLDGLVSSSIEYGVEVHPAALLVQGHTDRVRHRLWRGQVTLMLPLLDSIRLNMCQELTRRFGQGWPLRLTPPRTEEEVTALKVSALACEYGRLEFLLRQDGRLVDYRTSWQPLAARAKAVRNTLAHYQPVTFGDFEWLESEARKAGVAVSP